jgi:hypothetical protein
MRSSSRSVCGLIVAAFLCGSLPVLAFSGTDEDAVTIVIDEYGAGTFVKPVDVGNNDIIGFDFNIPSSPIAGGGILYDFSARQADFYPFAPTSILAGDLLLTDKSNPNQVLGLARFFANYTIAFYSDSANDPAGTNIHIHPLPAFSPPTATKPEIVMRAKTAGTFYVPHKGQPGFVVFAGKNNKPFVNFVILSSGHTQDYVNKIH